MTTVFVLGLGCALTALFVWAFKTLPQEHWQFIGAVPARKNALRDSFDGVNFTWYGFFSALAYAGGTALFVFLMGSVGVPLIGAILAAAPVMLICGVSANWMVRLVEGKTYGFTVGGASFVGLFVAPACLFALAESAPLLGFATPIPAGLAAMGIAYVLGEGIGRLACISFGCCYGKPVDQTRGWLRRFSERFHFVFAGDTKKICFAAGLQGVPVVPVQAMTPSFYALCALSGLALFFQRQYGWAVAVAVGSCQIWRVYSETFRADYRGDRRFTAYQWMALSSACVALAAPLAMPGGSGSPPDFRAGAQTLWSSSALLFLQAVWAAGFLYAGRSTQTKALLRFSVLEDRV
jgi:hypothetical protein